MQAVAVLTATTTWTAIVCLALLGGTVMASAPISERSGERGIGGGERLALTVPQESGALVLRFTEIEIDLEVTWSVDGVVHRANAPGRRWGEQVLVLSASVADRPDQVYLQTVLDRPPQGQIRWAWERMTVIPQGLMLESAAAELASSGNRDDSLEALRLYSQALDLYRNDLDSRWIDLSYRVGQLHSRLFNWSASEAVYRPALLEAREHRTVARLNDGLGYALYRQGKHEEAKQVFERAREEARLAGDDYQHALSSNNSCLLLHAQADMRAAVDCLRKAERKYAAAGIIEERGVLLINLASAMGMLGDRAGAIEILQEAIELQQPMTTRAQLRTSAVARMHLAWVLVGGGRFAEAVQHGMEAQALAHALEDDWLTGQLIRASAAALAGLGEWDRAQDQLSEILNTPRLLAAVSDSPRLAFAIASLERDAPRRLAALARARADAGIADDDFTYVRAWLAEGEVSAALGDTQAAAAAARGSLSMARRLALAAEEVRAMVLLAQVEEEPRHAQDIRAAALELASHAGLSEARFVLLHAQARAAVIEQRFAEARHLVVEAEGVWLDLRQELSLDEFASYRRRMRQASFGSLSPALLDPGLTLEDRAAWVWERLATQHAWSAGGGADIPNAAEYVALRDALAGSAPGISFRVSRLELEAVERQVAPLPWPALSAVARGLRPGEGLLILTLDNPASGAIVVTNGHASVHTLASAMEIETSVSAVRRGLERQDPVGQGALRARVQQLATLLKDPIEALAGSERVRFVPGPGLDMLPLELLVPAGTPVTRLSTDARSGARGDLSSGRVLVLDPAPDADSGQSDWVALPAIDVEIAHLESMLDPGLFDRLRGVAAATALADLAQAGPLRILHVAGHGLPDQGWSSLDVLAFGEGLEHQAPLGSLRQLQSVDVALVVLSACRTAFGGRGESVLSFTHSFLSAGASQVLASAWEVDDRATSTLMSLFYEAHLRHGLGPEESLLVAQDAMRSDPRWSAPYFWAGFQLWEGLPAAAAPY